MRLLMLVTMLALTGLSWSAQAEIVVVVSKSSSIMNLTERDIRRIFLAKSRLLNGSRVQPFELSNTDFKSQFYEKVTGKNLRQLNSYWTTLIFTGKGRPPKNVDKAEALLNKLSENPLAIAYMPVEYLDDRLKVVHRVE